MMSIAALVPHFAVLGIWAACAAIAEGVGLLLLRLLLPRPVEGEGRAFAALWIGLAAITLFQQAWNFAFPIDGRALLIVVAAGVMGLVLSWASIARLPRGRPQARVVLATLFFLAFAAWLADRSLAVFAAHDSEVYMIPAVEWAKAWPVVPGLGALHGRLAFNNSTVLLAALLEAGPWAPAAPHLLCGFFLSVMAARLATRLGSTGRNAIASAFDILLLAPLVAMALDDQLLPSLSADVGVAVAVFAATSLLLERLAADPAEPRRPAAPLAAAAALAFAVTLKLSAAAFALTGGTLALIIVAADARAGALRARARVLSAALGLALVGTWAVRGIVQSGYPLYPVRLLPAPVEWRVPAEQAQAEAAWIAHFARTWYDTSIANADSVAEYAWSRFHWLRPWLAAQAGGRDAGMIVLPAALGLLSGMVLLVRRKRGSGARVRWLAAPAAAGLLFWFAAAPRPSMGLGPAWVLAALASAHLFAGSRGRAALHASFALSLALAAIVILNAVRSADADPETTRAWRVALFAWVDPDDWFREPAAPPMHEYRTDSGLMLSVPDRTNLCRREPLPCTPHPAPNLSLRRAGDLGGGFAIEGEWKAERWPNAPSRFLRSWRESRIR